MLRAVAALVLTGTFLTACVSADDVARDRASKEFDCARDRVQLRWLAYAPRGSVFKIVACGHVATYICNEDDQTCITETYEQR